MCFARELVKRLVVKLKTSLVRYTVAQSRFRPLHFNKTNVKTHWQVVHTYLFGNQLQFKMTFINAARTIRDQMLYDIY